MAQEQGRFSPAQILMAAEKAENDGRLEHALQFYRYIVEQQSGAPEAEFARSAMDRLTPSRPQASEAPRSSYPITPWPTNEPHGIKFEVPQERTAPPSRYQPQQHGTAPAGGVNGHQRNAPFAVPVTDAFAPPQPASYASRTQPRGEPLHQQARMPVLIKLPPPKRGYRSGRVLAMMMTVSGALAMLAGVAMIGLAVFAPGILRQVGPGIDALLGIGGSIGAIFVGAVLLLAGQLARAVFDGANAVRELVAIERAMARQSGRPATSDDE